MSLPKRPGVDEYDAGGWLEGSLSEHDVIAVTGNEYRLDGAPSHRTDGISHGESSFPTRCPEHAYRHAADLGYEGPVAIRTSYRGDLLFLAELAMLLRDDTGRVVSVATYSYGRAYFEPGEPRNDPCAVCGVETLVKSAWFED